MGVLARLGVLLLKAVRALTWRAVAYNQGAWAALALGTTVVLGFLRLMLTGAGDMVHLEGSASAGARALTTASTGEEDEMNAVKIAAVVLIAAGILGLLYGSFSFTKETHEIKLGPVELSVKEKQTVNVPVWAGVGAIVVGVVLLLFGGKMS
jgi:uncharacterized membrane protein YidH (DUF202 family)